MRIPVVTVTPLSHPDGRVALGNACSFALARSAEGIETRVFIRHGLIRSCKPLAGWSRAAEITFFPEAPGDYRLIVAWRAPGGAGGLVDRAFRVVGGRVDSSPRLARIGWRGRLWAPSAWEAAMLKGYEGRVFGALERIVRPGWTVYDVGASLGQYALRFSRLVGGAGRVYCIEANPVCVYFLNASLALNRAENCEILPVAILEGSRTARFTVNYGNLALGVSQVSSLFGTKGGHEIAVDSCSLDELREMHGLRKPDFIKIDIEGAESAAVAGMAGTIARDRPALLIEVHGREAATATFGTAAWSGYRFEHPESGQSFADAAALLAWHPASVQQILCLPR